MQMTAVQVFSAKTHNLHLVVFKALALNGMALALYFMALFTYPRHQSQPVIIWFKYETLSAHQLLYSTADTECISEHQPLPFDDKHIFSIKHTYIFF